MTDKDEVSILEIIQKIKDIFNFLLKKWVIICIISIIGAAAGFIYVSISKPKYASTLSFVVDGKSSTSGLAGIANMIGLGGGINNQVFTPENIVELMKSRTLIQKALMMPQVSNPKKSLADLYVEFHDLNKKETGDTSFQKIYFKPYLKANELSLNQNKMIERIYNQLILKELEIEIKNPKNSIIYIDINTINEEFSRYFPENLINVTSEYYIESKTRKAKINYETIKQQTDSVRQELNNAISGVAVANDNTFLLNPAYNVKRVPTAHKEVNVQANTAILTELVKNLELSRMNLLNETPVIEIIDTPVSPLKKQKIGKIKGILIGGIIGSFLIIISLIGKGIINKNF
jgi:uncharacterized protein involved in exopolysaccharide biosynthesis